MFNTRSFILKEETFLKIAKYKCQLAELDRQWWFENLNSKFQEYANSSLKGILGVDTDPKVSSDYNHDSRSSILDLSETSTVTDNFGRVLTWYDNECGFSNRMLETTAQVCNL